MHDLRIKRHNIVAAYACSNLRGGKKPRYQAIKGLHRSDIVANIGQLGVVIDVQVISHQSDLEQAGQPDAKISTNVSTTRKLTGKILLIYFINDIPIKYSIYFINIFVFVLEKLAFLTCNAHPLRKNREFNFLL